jgi:hypothetical protein
VDDPSFGLSEHLRVLYYAGIRSVLSSVPEPPRDILLSVSPWFDFLSKLPITARSIWSYSDLIYDLTGNASRARGDLWRSMIRYMDLPKGFIGFFPYTLPAENNLTTHVEHFFELILSHVPTSLIIFGDDCFAEKIRALVHSSAKDLSHVRVVAAPSPETLCSFSSDDLESFSLNLRPSLLNAT